MMAGFGMGLGGGLVMVLFWVVLIVGTVWLVRGLFPISQQPSVSATRPEASAEDILKQHYASGEVSKEQYDQMRRDLSA